MNAPIVLLSGMSDAERRAVRRQLNATPIVVARVELSARRESVGDVLTAFLEGRDSLMGTPRNDATYARIAAYQAHEQRTQL